MFWEFWEGQPCQRRYGNRVWEAEQTTGKRWEAFRENQAHNNTWRTALGWDHHQYAGRTGIPELQTARNRFRSDLTGSRMLNGPVWVCSKFGELWRLCQDCVCCQVGFGFKGEKSERPCNLENTDGLVLTSESYREMNGMLDGLAPKK